MTCLITIKKIGMIYFTNFPYVYHNRLNQESNFGLIGVSHECIYAQQTFWFANIGSLVFMYNIKNTDFYYYHQYLLIWSIILYLISFKKVANIIKYIR